MLTTGQVARMCGCSPVTVQNWFDRGLITGARLPRSGHRRISEQSLRKFAASIGIELLEIAEASGKTGTLPRRRGRAKDNDSTDGGKVQGR